MENLPLEHLSITKSEREQAPAVETKGGEHGQPRGPSVGRKSK